MSKISSKQLIYKKPIFILHSRSQSKIELKSQLSASHRRLKTTLLGSRDFRKQKILLEKRETLFNNTDQFITKLKNCRDNSKENLDLEAYHQNRISVKGEEFTDTNYTLPDKRLENCASVSPKKNLEQVKGARTARSSVLSVPRMAV
jgi:hypothetical protein